MLGEKRKPVSFNLDLPEERKLYEWSCTINFSRFVKRAMSKELRKNGEWSQAIQHNATQAKPK